MALRNLEFHLRNYHNNDSSLMLCAKFGGNLLRTFKVMVKELFAYFIVNIY